MTFVNIVEIVLNIILAVSMLISLIDAAKKKTNLKALMNLSDVDKFYIKKGLLHYKGNLAEITLDYIFIAVLFLGSAASLYCNGLHTFAIINIVIFIIVILCPLIRHLFKINGIEGSLVVKAFTKRTHKDVNHALIYEIFDELVVGLYAVAVTVGLFM